MCHTMPIYCKVTEKTCLCNFTTIFFVLQGPHFGVNLYEGWSLVDFSVEEICGVGGKKFITQCVMCITHCDMYKTHCIMYKTHCVMKNFVGSEGFSIGVFFVLVECWHNFWRWCRCCVFFNIFVTSHP